MPGVISDSSTLIHLARIGRLSLLREMFEDIIIPSAVWQEVVVEGRGRAGAQEVETALNEGWIRLVEVVDHLLLKMLKRELDDGEAEAIALALELKAQLLLIDESEGREVATLYDLPKTGVVGILMRARLEGRIESLRRELDALREDGGFWISEALYRKAIEAVEGTADCTDDTD